MEKRSPLGQVADGDIRLLRVFRSVTECGGFAAAELQLNIGRSTISRHIADLEVRLGLRLCRRGRGGFALTAEGRQVYDAAIRVISALDGFRTDLADLHHRLTGRLSIALFDKTATNPASAIGEAIQRFHDQATAVELAIHVEPLNEIERGVIEGQFHLGVIPSHRMSSSLSYHPLFVENMLLYCGRSHALFARKDANLSISDVRKLQFAGLGYHSQNMEASLKLGLRSTATCFDQEGVAHLILSGRFIGFLPDHYAQHFVDRGLMRSVCPDRYHYECRFDAIVRREPAPTRAAAMLLQCLAQAHGKPLAKPRTTKRRAKVG